MLTLLKNILPMKPVFKSERRDRATEEVFSGVLAIWWSSLMLFHLYYGVLLVVFFVVIVVQCGSCSK